MLPLVQAKSQLDEALDHQVVKKNCQLAEILNWHIFLEKLKGKEATKIEKEWIDWPEKFELWVARNQGKAKDEIT